MSRISLIIPAAGSGSRLDRDTPKPFIEVGGRTILEHTLRCFEEVDGLAHVIVATSAGYMDRVEKILASIGEPGMKRDVVEGGKERQHSIHNALALVEESELVIVHDAVRPFVTSGQIQLCCRTAAEKGGAVLGVPAKDTIKKVDRKLEVEDTPSRKYLWQAQTPQVFRTEIIREAYRRASEEGIVGTDDASLVERLGYRVRMVEGGRTNFKITYPLDLKLATLLLNDGDGHENG